MIVFHKNLVIIYPAVSQLPSRGTENKRKQKTTPLADSFLNNRARHGSFASFYFSRRFVCSASTDRAIVGRSKNISEIRNRARNGDRRWKKAGDRRRGRSRKGREIRHAEKSERLGRIVWREDLVEVTRVSEEYRRRGEDRRVRRRHETKRHFDVADVFRSDAVLAISARNPGSASGIPLKYWNTWRFVVRSCLGSRRRVSKQSTRRRAFLSRPVHSTERLSLSLQRKLIEFDVVRSHGCPSISSSWNGISWNHEIRIERISRSEYVTTLRVEQYFRFYCYCLVRP